MTFQLPPPTVAPPERISSRKVVIAFIAISAVVFFGVVLFKVIRSVDRNKEARPRMELIWQKAVDYYEIHKSAPKSLEDMGIKPRELDGAHVKAAQFRFGGTAREWWVAYVDPDGSGPRDLTLSGSLASGKPAYSQ